MVFTAACCLQYLAMMLCYNIHYEMDGQYKLSLSACIQLYCTGHYDGGGIIRNAHSYWCFLETVQDLKD